MVHLSLGVGLALTPAWATAAAQPAAAPGTPAKSSPAASPTPTPEPTPVPLPDVIAQADAAQAAVREIQTNLSSDAVRTAVRDGLPTIATEIGERLEDTTKVLSPSPSLDAVQELEGGWTSLGGNLDAWSRDLIRRGTELDARLGRVADLTKVWQITQGQARGAVAPREVLDRIEATLASLGNARASLEARRSEILRLQSQVAEQQSRVESAVASVRQAREGAVDRLWVRDSPPLWSAAGGSTTPETGPMAASQTSLAAQAKVARIYAERRVAQFFLHAGLIALIAVALRGARRWVRSWTDEDPDLQRSAPVFDAPLAAAMAASLLFVPQIYPDAPRLLRAGISGLALIPTAMLLRRLIERRHFPWLYATVALAFLGHLRLAVAWLPVVARSLFVAETLGGVAAAIYVLREHRRAGTTARSPVLLRLFARAAAVLLLAATLANVLGYVALATLVGTAILRGAYVGVLLYAAVRVLEGLVAIALEVRPLSYLRMVRRHRPLLRRRAYALLHLMATWTWLNFFLVSLESRNAAYDAARSFLNTPLVLGSLQLSLGHVLAFAVALALTFLVSRLIRFLLEEDVYDRFNLPRGLPYAISTLLHYCVILIGIFAAMAALGIDMTKFTILAGAFSVGIGFGLQNVINNFVSGLILLFERPIKVGDVIAVDTATGSVERIGIRASVIRTTEGSEVIIPNGTLISGQVTNWTFSDRHRVVLVGVNVARTAEPTKVAELLRVAAANNADILKSPAPQAYVTTLSAAALTVELRAWTDRYDDWLRVRSELVSDVNARLLAANVTLA